MCAKTQPLNSAVTELRTLHAISNDACDVSLSRVCVCVVSYMLHGCSGVDVQA